MSSQSRSSLREALPAILAFLATAGVLFAIFPADLLFSPEAPTGGDMGSHFAAAEILRARLLSGGPPVGWVHGNFLGFPLFLHYFPLPFALAVLLSLAAPLAVAVKLVVVLSAAALPAACFFCMRALGFRRPVPALSAGLSLGFLLQRGNSMWGGNIASTLAGEFAFALALSLAVLLTGRLFRDAPRGRGLFGNAGIEALVALSNGYPLVQVAAGSAWFFFRRGARRYVLFLHALAFAFAGFFLVPLVSGLPWNTAFSHAWVIASWSEVAPPLLFPAFVGIAAGWARGLWERARGLASDPPQGAALSYLWFQGATALFGFAVASALGLVDARFLPFAQVVLVLLGAAGWGRALAGVRFSGALVCALIAGVGVWGILDCEPLPSWARWNFAGLHGKPLEAPYTGVTRFLRGTENDPRVGVEHSAAVNGAGTVRAFEVLPQVSGRSTLEGLYLQSSLSSPFVFFVQSELSREPSTPFPGLTYSALNPERGAAHLRFLNVSQFVATTPETARVLDESAAFVPEAGVPPFRVYRVAGGGGGYVEPVRFQPLRIPEGGWKEVQFAWFRASSLDVPLVVDRHLGPSLSGLAALSGPPGNPPRTPFPGAEDMHAEAVLGPDSITITTSRPGHPLWVKVSWHPRWRVAEGEAEVALASPAFMLVVPKTPRVVLRFETRSGAYAIGWGLTAAALAGWVGFAIWRRGRRGAGSGAGELSRGGPPWWVWVFGGVALGALLWGRAGRDPVLLYEKAVGALKDAETMRADDPARRRAFERAHEAFALDLARFPHSSCAALSALEAGRLFIGEGRHGEAEALLSSHLREFPESMVACAVRYHLGLCALASARIRDAAARFQEAVEGYPWDPWARHAAIRYLEVTPPEEVFSLAQRHFDAGRFMTASRFARALREAPAFEAESSLLLARSLRRGNDPKEAARVLEAWLHAHPEHPRAPEALAELALARIALGDPGAAREPLAEALARDGYVADGEAPAVLRAIERHVSGEGP